MNVKRAIQTHFKNGKAAFSMRAILTVYEKVYLNIGLGDTEKCIRTIVECVRLVYSLTWPESD